MTCIIDALGKKVLEIPRKGSSCSDQFTVAIIFWLRLHEQVKQVSVHLCLSYHQSVRIEYLSVTAHDIANRRQISLSELKRLQGEFAVRKLSGDQGFVS